MANNLNIPANVQYLVTGFCIISTKVFLKLLNIFSSSSSIGSSFSAIPEASSLSWRSYLMNYPLSGSRTKNSEAAAMSIPNIPID
jgi:hypothetical protein